MGRSTIGRGWPMVHLEDWMNIQQLHQLGLSQCQIAERLDLDRKTVRKYLQGPPQGYATPMRLPVPTPFSASRA